MHQLWEMRQVLSHGCDIRKLTEGKDTFAENLLGIPKTEQKPRLTK